MGIGTTDDGTHGARRAAPPHETTSGALSPPFFVVGPVRSGTTLLRLMLGHHPGICRCEEFEFVAGALAKSESWPDLEAYRNELNHRLDVRISELGDIPDAPSFPELARRLLELLARADGKKLYGATVHNHFDHLIRVWPNAKFIYLRRDPRDVARSCVGMGWAGNAWAGTPIWIAAHSAWMRLAAAVPAQRRLEVAYEDLVRDAEAELTRICRFLDVAYDARMLEIEKDTTYERPNPKASRSWRDGATELEIRAVEARLGDLLAESGYLPSALPPLSIGRMRAVTLKLDDRIRRMRFRQRRYGLTLWAMSWLAARTHIDGFRRCVQAKVDAITIRHLK